MFNFLAYVLIDEQSRHHNRTADTAGAPSTVSASLTEFNHPCIYPGRWRFSIGAGVPYERPYPSASIRATIGDNELLPWQPVCGAGNAGCTQSSVDAEWDNVKQRAHTILYDRADHEKPVTITQGGNMPFKFEVRFDVQPGFETWGGVYSTGILLYPLDPPPAGWEEAGPPKPAHPGQHW